MKLNMGLLPAGSITEAVEWAKIAEDYGFTSVGFTEDTMYKSGWPVLFLAAQATSRVQLGTTLCNPHNTHPAILATYAGMLDELSDGRAFLGLGRGHLEVLKSMLNVVPAKPLTALKEAIEVSKRLWSGDATPYHGAVFTATEEAVFQWEPLRPQIPILVGGWGPKVARMAGGHADRLLPYGVWNPTYAKLLQQSIAEGEQEAGRDPGSCELELEPVFTISEDAAEAKEKARESLSQFINILSPMTTMSIDAELLGRINSAIDRQDFDEAKSLISDDILDNFALYGTPHQVIEKMEAMESEVGLTSISFDMPFGAEDVTKYLHLLGKHVAPHFAAK